MKRIKQFLIIFIIVLIAFMISKEEVKAGELPISVEGIELTAFYNGVDNTYEIVLDSNQTTVMIDYNHEEYIWGSGVGEVTLEIGKVHPVVVMNSEGVVTVHDIYPTRGRAKLNNISMDGVDISFNKNIYIYDLIVENEIDTFTPTIDKDASATINISNTNLKVGNNSMKIDVSKSGLESTIYTFNIYRNLKADAEPTVETFNYTGSYQEFTAPYSLSFGFLQEFYMRL